MDRLRKKSVRQTQYMIALFDAWLAPLGFTLGSPRDASVRGSHVSVKHKEAFRISRAMAESPPPAVRVVPDFRAPDNIRMGVTPLYTTYAEIFKAMARIREITEERVYENFSSERKAVT